MDTEAHLADFYPPIPDEPGMPPAYAKISPMQRAWLHAYLDAGDENATAAARRAGYGKEGTDAQKNQACKQAGYHNIHDADILEAIRELAHEKFRQAGYLATARLMELVKDPTHKDHFKAIERVLAQNGMIAALQIEHNHNVNVTEEDQIEKVKQLAARLGIDPRTLLGSAYTDAEFVEVKVLTAPEEPAMSSAGLEDLL
jgi:phage terminase small subunit